MATFTEIYYNGNEYKQIWLNGTKVWEKDSGGGEIVYPYPDVDSVITYKARSGTYPSKYTFKIIDDTLPYSINGEAINETYLNYGEKTKLINLKPYIASGSDNVINIEQLRVPKLTDLSSLFRYFCYNSEYECSWQPQYFEFHPNPTNMSSMFDNCQYLTDDMMNQFMPYFPNTSNVTDMNSMFQYCSSLTSLNLSNFDTSKVNNMARMFSDCSSLTSLDVSSFDTSKVVNMYAMFDNCSSLQSLNLSFNTSNVTDMSAMFAGCQSLKNLDISSFDTSLVDNMGMMFSDCSSLTSLNLSNFNTSKVINTSDMFDGVSNCTIYIGDKWTLGTSSNLGGGSNLTFVLFNPITNITLESTLTYTTITKGTQFTITPTITPTDYSGDELIITYDENYLSMVDNTFTVLDTATIGQQLDITYSSKNNPSVSTTYSVTIRDFATIESIVLQHSLESLVIEPNTTFTITPIITPTVHDDELMIEFDNTYITNDNGTFTITNAPFSEQLSIRYYSKLNPTVSATLDLTVREFIPITSISLTHTLESLTDVAIGTTFTVVPTVEPTVYDDELLVDYDTNYLSKDGDNYTVLGGASGQTVQVIYYSKHDNNVNAMLEFSVKYELVYPYPDADSVITFRNTSTSSQSISFVVIDSSLPYSINGTSTKSFTFPKSSETQLKFVNLKPRSNTSSVIPINIEQLRIPNLTDLSYLFSYFCYDSNYEYSWSPQYFEFHSNPTIMEEMFYNCKYLTEEIMAQFMPYFPNTSKVTTMNSMFQNCSSLTSLDLSSFDTSNVTMMNDMFENCSSLTTLNLSSFNTSQVISMNYMFYGCSSLTSLNLSSFNTSNVALSTNYTFSNVKNCTIYINTDKWTLGTSSSLGGGTNLTFLPIVIPIESINGITTDINDTTNVTEQYFTVTPNISPSNYSSDLEVIYDSTYLKSKNNKDFELLEGSNGQTLSITYRSKSNNSISETITFTVSEDFYIKVIDYSRFEEPTLPSWISKYSANCSSEVIYSNTSMIASNNIYVCGLKFTPNSSYKIIQKYCYKVIPPKDGILQFNYREEGHNSTYPFTIHITNSTSVPDVTSTTSRIAYDIGGNYQDVDGIVYSYPTVELKGGETYYVYIQNSSYATKHGLLRRIEFLESNIDQLALTHNIDDLTNALQPSFTITPIITPSCYTVNDLDVAYDSTYLSTTDNLKFSLKEGCQGKTLNITYRSKIGNPISDTLTFTVSQDLEIPIVIDFTTSTAPTLPYCMTLDGQGSSYYFSHGTYTTNVYGLVPNNKNKDNTIAYTRYKFIAPKDGALTFTYRCSSESSYDYLTVHVDTSTSQPSYSNSINGVVINSGTTYATTDGTASVNVTSGTTYYIHIQYRKDKSGNSGYDKGCIRKIELL